MVSSLDEGPHLDNPTMAGDRALVAPADPRRRTPLTGTSSDGLAAGTQANSPPCISRETRQAGRSRLSSKGIHNCLNLLFLWPGDDVWPGGRPPQRRRENRMSRAVPFTGSAAHRRGCLLAGRRTFGITAAQMDGSTDDNGSAEDQPGTRQKQAINQGVTPCE
jgi:hypothetical protein